MVIGGNKFLWLTVLLTPVLLFSCKIKTDKENVTISGDITEEAQLLSISEEEGFDDVVITDAKGNRIARYFLVDKDKESPNGLPEDGIVMRVPLESVVVDSEVYASALNETESLEAVSGIFDAAFVTLPDLRERIESHKVSDVGQPDHPNIEKLLELGPEAIMVSYYDGMQMTGIDKVSAPIVKMYDLQEPTPLGRAEWIRFIGRLVGNGDVADSIFHAVKKRYNTLKNEVTTTVKAPKVMTDLIYNGTWYVPGGASYQATLIKDAGGNYAWSDDKGSASLNLSLEQVLEKAVDSDVWLIKTYGDLTPESLAAQDSRYKEFQPYKTGRIYYSDTSRSGLFSEFPFHPERLLEDYIIIFRGDTEKPLRYFNILSGKK